MNKETSDNIGTEWLSKTVKNYWKKQLRKKVTANAKKKMQNTILIRNWSGYCDRTKVMMLIKMYKRIVTSKIWLA